jgi:RNA polymerase sigma-70 factor (ECF subfamily)
MQVSYNAAMPEELELLISKAKSGNSQAYGEIYKKYYERIYRFIYYMVYDPHLASDLTQNTFLKVWKSLSNFNENKGTFQAFIYAVARNNVIDLQRKKKILPLTYAQELTSSEDIQNKILTQEQKLLIHHTLGFLKPLEKQLIVLRYFEDLPMSEIAVIVGKHEGAVRVRIHRILQKMRAYLKQNNYEN